MRAFLPHSHHSHLIPTCFLQLRCLHAPTFSGPTLFSSTCWSLSSPLCSPMRTRKPRHTTRSSSSGCCCCAALEPPQIDLSPSAAYTWQGTRGTVCTATRVMQHSPDRHIGHCLPARMQDVAPLRRQWTIP